MKKKLLAGVAGLLGAGFASMAAAQSGPGVWPEIGLIDLEACRPVISRVHAIETRGIRNLVADQCGADPRKYSRSACKAARRWLGNTQARDHVVWYFEGNDSCATSDYPCFGVTNYNRRRAGEDATRWVQYIKEKAAVTPMVTEGMDLWTGVREADRCVARIWADKYDRANPPRRTPPPSAPLLASAAAAAKVVDEAEPKTTPAAVEAKPAASAHGATAAPTTEGASVAAVAAAPVAEGNAEPAVQGASSSPSAVGTAANIVADAASTALAAATVAAAAAPAAAQASAGSAALVAAAATPVAAAVESALKAAPILIVDIEQSPPAPPQAESKAGASAEAAKNVDPPAATTVQGAGAKTAEAPPPASVVPAAPAGAAATAAPAPAPSAPAPLVVAAAAKPEELAGGPASSGNAKLDACRAGVAAKRDLDKALIACFTTGKTDGEVLTLRGQIHLLAGRFDDAWNDFNIAWTSYKATAGLFLRGLASVGLGKTAIGLKDMAEAEEAQAGLAESWAAQGYSLAGAMARKPLAPQDNAPVAQPAAPAPAAPPAAVVEQAPAKPPAEAAPAPASSAAAVPVSLPAGGPAAPALPPVTAIGPAPITPPIDVNPDPVPVRKAEAAPQPVAYDATLPQDDPRKTATDCLEPLQEGDPGNPERDDVFRNKCNYAVRFAYCNVPAMSNGPNMPFSCGSTTGLMVHMVAANSVQPVRLGRQVAYFGCKAVARPDIDYSSEKGLFGYCR